MYLKDLRYGDLFCIWAWIQEQQIDLALQDIQSRVKRSTLFYCIQINIRSNSKLIQFFQQQVFRHTQCSLLWKFIIFEGYLNFFLWLCWLRYQRKSCVSGETTGNNLYPCFVNWGTTRFCLIFTFHLSILGLISFCG